MAHAGRARQKDEWLRRLASGSAVGAFALSEADAGTDAANQLTRAERIGERLSDYGQEGLGRER